MADTKQPEAAAPKKKFKIRSGAKSFSLPGFPNAEYTEDHLNGEHGEMIVRAMKKKQPDLFAKMVEEVK